MGDVSMEDFGCVAISPLWLGGKESNREVTVLHNVPKIVGATEVTEGLYSGGWGAARPKVSDSTYAEGRFKFFLGATAWGAGELEAEFKSGAWVVLDCEPDLVVCDRVLDWAQVGKKKPFWRHLVELLGDRALLEKVYRDKG
jgi:putative AlgH/UPF0301 family transcriptional regulator